MGLVEKIKNESLSLLGLLVIVVVEVVVVVVVVLTTTTTTPCEPIEEVEVASGSWYCREQDCHLECDIGYVAGGREAIQ